MTYEKPWMKLSIHFDADQISNQLDYTFTSCDGSAHPQEGPNTGGVQFQPGQHVYLDINCCGTGGFTEFEIVDCNLITIPQIIQIAPELPTLYSPPSPFLQCMGATYAIPLEFKAHVLPPDPAQPDLRRIRQEWQQSLDVAQNKGRWELIFVMTVRIIRGDQELPELRVFSFDPEASVGGRVTP